MRTSLQARSPPLSSSTTKFSNPSILIGVACLSHDHRHDDAVLVAIASNNVIAINKEHDVFDSKKKMKAATLDSLANKVSLLAIRLLV
jgi:hypothetical protein